MEDKNREKIGNNHVVYLGRFPDRENPNEKYVAAIDNILKALKGNNIDKETYDRLSKCVDEIHETFGVRLSFDADHLIEKGDSPESIEVLLNAIKHRTGHVSEDLREELLKISNQIKEKNQTDITYDNDNDGIDR